MQLYADLAVLTPRPPREESAGPAPPVTASPTPPTAGRSAAGWTRRAPVLADIAARRRAGDRGRRHRALLPGADPGPGRHSGGAARGDRRAGARTSSDARASWRSAPRLARLDPEAEARIARGDRQRLVRALAVAEHTGRALSAWQADTAAAAGAGRWRGVVLEPPRAALYARLRRAAGGDVRRRRDRGGAGAGGARARPRAAGDEGGGRARDRRAPGGPHQPRARRWRRAQQETRRFAKRQLTWFRNQTPDWPRIASADPADQWRALQAMLGA